MLEQSSVLREMERKMDKVKQVYIGHDSLITSLGEKMQTFYALEQKECGLCYNEKYGMIVGAINRDLPLAYQQEGCTFFESLVINNILAIINESKLEIKDQRLLVILSTTKGNINKLEENVSPVPEDAFLGTTALKLQAYLGFSNLPLIVSNACISGVSALIIAREIILQGKYDNIIVVGCDTLSPFITEGFASFKSISSKPCRPYDKNRDGLCLGEACGAILLTSDKSQARRPYLYLNGGAITNDANHISGPSRTGDGLYLAIERALSEANLDKNDIGFINAHGTSTVYNDEMESKAIALAGLTDKPINSFKSYIGHTLGASGVVETILCIQELLTKRVFATLGFEELGTSCTISVSSNEQTFTKEAFIKTASGFGGCNAAIAVSSECYKGIHPNYDIHVKEVCHYSLPVSCEVFHDFIRAEYKKLGETNMKFYKMSDLCKAAYVSMANLLEQYSLNQYSPEDISIVLANRSSSLDADIEHQKVINKHSEEGASPAIFVYTLPNVVNGELCIRHKIKGNNTFFVEDKDNETAEKYAKLLIETGKAKAVICGWCEKLSEKYEVNLKLLIREK